MKQSAPLLLSFNGGYVDTAGFLALHGLFAAHVTGNFVTFGAAMVEGTSGAFAKLLALPVFCATIVLARVIAVHLGASGPRALKTMLLVKVLLLAVAASFALAWGPFPDGDSGRAILTGMILVCAMAIQNAAHRVYLPKAPPSTLMTGTTTQVMLDLADLLSGAASQQQRSDIRGRLRKMVPNIVAFAAGCGVAALIFIGFGLRAFLLPPLVAIAIVTAIHLSADPEIA
ncbi:YoaK family protein [Nitrobacter sp. TKz-YC02]|uniref:YoaK family protein n=1 Tax=Nitrobacter sp. TKz-YC02 TaxID=3398704 RepID=UPI003CF04943